MFNGIHMTMGEIDELEPLFDSQECIDFVRDDLINILEDDSIAKGVCRFFISNGYSALSEKQKYAFKVTLQQNLLKCERDGEFLFEEAGFIIENGLCTYCQKVWDSYNDD